MRMYTVNLLCSQPVADYLQGLISLQTSPIEGGLTVVTCRQAFLRWFLTNPLSSSGWTSATISGFGSPEDKRDVVRVLAAAGLQTFDSGDTLDVFAV